MQFYTGHGNFKSYLVKIKSKNCVSPYCQCGAEQTSNHVLFECPEIEEKRAPLKEMIEIMGHTWPCTADIFLQNKETYLAFKSFARRVLSKETSELT